jgi:PTS system nitrogen regulatory IIA component
MTTIQDVLDPELVTFLTATDRNEALLALVDRLNEAGKLRDREIFYQAILEREQIVSTGIGMGVAIPHAKLPNYNNFFIAIGVSKTGLEWNSLDNYAVRLIFLIGGPDDKQTEYLQILSSLTLAIKDEERRKQMLSADNAEDLIQVFNKF